MQLLHDVLTQLG